MKNIWIFAIIIRVNEQVVRKSGLEINRAFFVFKTQNGAGTYRMNDYFKEIKHR